jgi:hypothetical protein
MDKELDFALVKPQDKKGFGVFTTITSGTTALRGH